MKTENFSLPRSVNSSWQAGRRLWTVALAGLFATAMTLPAQLEHELFFSDTFDVSENSMDVNFEHEGGRQNGPLAPLTYTDNAGSPERTQLNHPSYPSRLYLFSSGDQNSVTVSPDHNFIEGSSFIIEFEVDPGANDPANESTDWAAIVFGATQKNVFVNASDGMGVLFRNQGDIQVFDGGPAIYGGDGEFPGGIPTGESFQVRIEVEADGFGLPATVSMFVNDIQVRLSDASLSHVKAAGFLANHITLQGYAGGGNAWEHLFDNFSVSAVPCIQVGPSALSVIQGELTDPVTVTIPGQLNAATSAQVIVSSDNPLVAVPTGADEGALTLDFPAAGATVQTFTVSALAAGTANLNFVSAQDACVIGSVRVVVSAGIAIEELVFLDTFQTDQQSLDINFPNEPGRQSGSAAPLNYVENPNTAGDGFLNYYTQIGHPEAPGKLALEVFDAPALGYAWVSPDHNFIEGGEFTIEFDVHPGANRPERDSGDWVAVVFGATGQGNFVNASNGLGILFRNNGQIQVFDGGSLVYDGDGGWEGGLPAGEFSVRLEVSSAGFGPGIPATVAMYVNDVKTRISNADNLEYIKTGGFLANHITLGGIGQNLLHTIDNLSVVAQACVHAGQTAVNLMEGQSSGEITIWIPSALNASQNVQVTITSSAPEVAAPVGAVNGVLTLDFPQGSATTQAIVITGEGKGQAVLSLSTEHGVCLGDPIVVTVRSALVRNPSFEENSHGGVGYGPIAQWFQIPGNQWGVNVEAQPFHDNGVIPDREQVAFHQGNGGIGQTINGLVPGEQYWIQFRYNARAFGGVIPTLAVHFGGVELDFIPEVVPVGAGSPYHFRQIPFTPSSESGDLEFHTTVVGDGTVLFDAVTIVKREEGNAVVRNPSFEASGHPPSPGIITGRISGWTSTGTVGVNFTGAGPFADNGMAPDQDMVAFINGPGSLSQSLSGLIAGEEYTLSFAANAQSGTSPNLRVSVGEAVLVDEEVAPVGGLLPYHDYAVTFTAGTVNTLVFEQTSEGEHALLLDDVKVLGEVSAIPCIEIAPDTLSLTLGQTGVMTVTVPFELIAAEAAFVTVASTDTSVAVPGGSVDGELTLEFAAGGDTSQQVQVETVGAGSATFVFSNEHGVCFNEPLVTVNVLRSLVKNPSFEDSPVGSWPGYGAILHWQGGSGLNPVDAGGPFHDNGLVPDRAQVAFMQNVNTMSQQIGGLEAGQQYWLQFYYNRRAATDPTDLIIRFDGADIDSIFSIEPVGADNPYHFRHIQFTPANESGLLEFMHSQVGNDGTTLLDAVTIVQRDPGQIVVRNPSFEASGRPSGVGYIQPARIAGWTATGNYGVNIAGVGPFADNGSNPDQDLVAFVQGLGSLSQTVSGLTPGEVYTLSWAYNARSGNSPRLQVSVGGAVLFDQSVSPVGGGAPYHQGSVSFLAGADSETITFAQAIDGDQTVLLDNVRIVPGGDVPAVRIEIELGAEPGTVRISWPASATGFVLLYADELPGVWQPVPQPIIVENDRNTVTDTTGNAMRFYQLQQAD